MVCEKNLNFAANTYKYEFDVKFRTQELKHICHE